MFIGAALGAIGAVSKFVKSPVGKKVGNIIGGIFNRKKKKKGNNQYSGNSDQGAMMATAINPMIQDIGNNKRSLTAKEVAEKVNDILGTATEDVRKVNVSTSVSPVTMGIGAALLLGLLAVFAIRK